MMTCIMPMASDTSAPGRIGMCQSASRAVRVLTGSITTSFAPFRLASAMNGQWCRLVLIVLQAQRMIYLEYLKLSGSIPGDGPMVMKYAVHDPESQNVLSLMVAP